MAVKCVRTAHRDWWGCSPSKGQSEMFSFSRIKVKWKAYIYCDSEKDR